MRSIKVSKLFAFMLLFVISGCNNVKNKSLTPQDYIQWHQDMENGMIQIKVVGEFKYSLFRQSPEYRASKEWISNPTKSIEELVSKYGTDQYLMRIEHIESKQSILEYDVHSDAAYYQRLDFLNSAFSRNISFTSQGNKLTPIAYQFIQSYKLAPHIEMVFAFDAPSEHEGTLTINDVLFGAGPLNFSIENNNKPALKSN